ncbi:hypothetical protein AMQ84_18085 [Paenibacillus riograndensis]|uniref:Uncharacterized protein n=1 Tax=Paenibacillus riograndensis TaxID=483937 RepID=A0A132TV27_9BACL|nr:hypothetical protein [Paenibacillus riograndensis]KWX75179.1 hypothetical protein AMQ84_18085 [Paenibacillus riograndensis]
MKEREPKWYEEARNGPFRESRFTEAAADKVIMQVRSGAPGLERAGNKLRLSFIAAAIILLLAGAGVLLQQQGLLGEGRQAGVFYQEVKTPDLTDAGLRKTAERIMQEQLGKKLPVVSLERMERINEVRIVFEDGEYTSTLRINTEIGQVTEWNMNVFYPLKEIDPQLINEAVVNLRDNGYEGNFTVTGLERSSQYSLVSNREVRTHDVLLGKEGRIDYENGIYAGATINLNRNEVSEEVIQKSDRALKLLRGEREDHLYQITRGLAAKWDVIILKYGEDENGPSTVIMDYATHEILHVQDNSLHIEESYDSKIHGEQDTKILTMDNAKLQSSAAVIADELFGIRLEDYTVVNKMIGNILFESPSGDSRIYAAYNDEGVFYAMVRQITTP